MNRSFYSSQRYQDFSKKHNRPSAFRVLIKKRNNQPVDQFETMETQSVRDQAKSVSLKSKGKDIKSLLQNNSFKNKLASTISKSSKIIASDKLQNKLRSTSRSRASEAFAKLQKNEEQTPLTLGQIQQKIQNLIQQKLNKIKSFRSFKNTIKQKDQIDLQLQRLLYILGLCSKNDINGELEENLEVINSKIGLLQKVIAESSTESQMMKKYFHSKRMGKQGSKKRQSNTYKSLQLLKEASRYITERKNTPKSIHFDSIAKTSFKCPNKNDYPIKSKKPAFVTNNQPLPRSSYERQYLVYGNLPNYSYRHGQSKILGSNSSFENRSSYQAEFTQKSSKRINFKELDCFRDKFRNLKVSFNQEEKKDLSSSKANYTGYLHEKQKRLPESHYINNLMTQSRVNYDEKLGKKAIIKHQNLAKLKYSYKSTIHA